MANASPEFLRDIQRQLEEKIQDRFSKYFFGFDTKEKYNLIEKIIDSSAAFHASRNIKATVVHLDRNQILMLQPDSTLYFNNGFFKSKLTILGMEIRETEWPGPHFS